MRTPGHDLDLAAGWLVSEAGLRHKGDIVGMKAFAASPRSMDVDRGNKPEDIDTVRVELAAGIELLRARVRTSRRVRVVSAVPMCWMLSPSLTRRCTLQDGDSSQDRRWNLFVQMRARQKMFDLTGALHAAALVGPLSEVLFVREDVGRHNAVDKVIGHALMEA